MNRKFKVGDRVVVVVTDWKPMGYRTVISSIDNEFYLTPSPEDGEGEEDPWYENELELESIYDSKLYKALHEV